MVKLLCLPRYVQNLLPELVIFIVSNLILKTSEGCNGPLRDP